MNESTITSLSDLSEDNRCFAEMLIDIIEAKYQGYVERGDTLNLERTHMPFGIKGVEHREHFVNRTPKLQGIAKRQGKPNENPLITAQRMLDTFCDDIREIEECDDGYGNVVYKLRKDGVLYKHVERLK